MGNTNFIFSITFGCMDYKKVKFMISIVISTYKEENLKNIVKNITQTIGQKFEIIPIENQNKYSIARAYNIGAQKAQYPYICFVHEDVLFQTENWGIILINDIESNVKLGLLGIVGTKRLSKYSLGWCDPFLPNELLTGHLNQGLNSWDKYRYDDFSPNKTGLDEVVGVDGLILFTKKEIWEHNNFDEKLISGFHGYDLDFSIKIINAGYKIAVDKNIMLYHYSLGKNDKIWLDSTISVLKKWRNFLPIKTNDLEASKFLITKDDILLFIRYIKNKIKYNLFN